MFYTFQINLSLQLYLAICDALHDLKTFAQFETCEKHQWRSVCFSNFQDEACSSTKVSLIDGCFSRFLNCKNGTKLIKASHISNYLAN